MEKERHGKNTVSKSPVNNKDRLSLTHIQHPAIWINLNEETVQNVAAHAIFRR